MSAEHSHADAPIFQDWEHVRGNATVLGGRFELRRALGDGSYAAVYEAYDRQLQRRVAVKLFNRCAPNEMASALREARLTASLRHENVLTVHDIGEHGGWPFLALELAQTDLRRWLDDAPRASADICAHFLAAGRGLAAAHRAGLVHHDFKPANVLIRPDGTVAVGDFGLARHLETVELSQERRAQLAAPNSLVRSRVGVDRREAPRFAFGTMRYIAPERLHGAAGDSRSDQFSFCVALWEALAGEHPFSGADADARYASIEAGPRGRPDAPSAVLSVLRRGLAVEPRDRFLTMERLLAALQAPPQRSRVFGQFVRHGLSTAATAGALAAAFVLAFGLSREAPALDMQASSRAALEAHALVEQAQRFAVDSEPNRAAELFEFAMLRAAKATYEEQRSLATDLEALGDHLDQGAAWAESARVFAAALALAEESRASEVTQVRLARKLSTAQARTRRQDR
ncbi:serine/threonine protein kinase [Plesiocystis pacifica SIR-1]|uniref:Serine/threonine protein kinase n=1 Tax=Plesiocystis pacifica SIR-1 TaxID=391625 RepID=A6GAZ8_9BACT|nr:serine/threonine-protein kinase [Plesiocystis pacifica]EDM76983.1 serine/threonine protein kinase [Plesiocystis pacifica SIR-1]